jgi:hypothetical protein
MSTALAMCGLAHGAISITRPCRELQEAEMDIKRSGSQSSGKGPSEYFTGSVRIRTRRGAGDEGATPSVLVTHLLRQMGRLPPAIQQR